MNKRQQLVADIAKEAGQTQKIAGDFLDAFQKVLEETLINGDEFVLTRSFIISAVDVGSRTVRNFATSEPMELPPHKKIVVKVSKKLKEAVNQ